MAQYFRYPAGATVSISAIGTNGAAQPSTSIQIGGQSPSNTLVPLSVDALGVLNVNVSSVPAGQTIDLIKVGGVAISLGQKAMAASLPITIASDQSALAISAASLPLPAGAATSANQTSEIAELVAANSSLDSIEFSTGGINSKTPALGQALGAASVPVVIASDQVVPISASALPLPSGAATEATSAAISGKLPATLGQKLMAASLAVTLASDQSALAVTVASLPLPSGAATETTLAAINTKTPALGQALAASSVPVVLTAAQLTTLTPLTSVTVTQATGTNLHTVVDSSALPTGAATETTLAAMSAKLPATLGQKAMAASLAVTLASDQSNLNTVAAGKTAITLVRNDYSSASVTTAAYTQLVASTSAAVSEIEIFDSSGQTLVLALGAAASEVNKVYIFPGGNGRIPLTIPSGTRVSIKAISADATVGEIDINFYG